MSGVADIQCEDAEIPIGNVRPFPILAGAGAMVECCGEAADPMQRTRRKAMGARTPLADLDRMRGVRGVDDPEVAARNWVQPLGDGGREQRVDTVSALEEIQLVDSSPAVSDPELAQLARVVRIGDVPEFHAECLTVERRVASAALNARSQQVATEEPGLDGADHDVLGARTLSCREP